MGQRKVKLHLDGLEVIGIKWRVEFHEEGHLSYKDALRKDPCVYCLAPSETWEHVTPKSQGGSDGWGNISRACQSCNNKRDIVPFFMFMITRDATVN